ncbi:type II toxin-antitoxin system Phd/YefM family antitoxin [Streptococcus anginosus]|uniref:type II toxin-antitoxin system Phd/YefM family antitoxin n=1 Tax=Streptococcus anginosus TaxID=1328 RepID=UPI0022DFC67C|nr:type II toxin-antitoxin system prevent-host-death family antitoxin [Streptococcus anginosus]
MEAVVYSNFRNNLKDYMKKVNDEYEPLMVVNKNPDENIVVLSKENWDSIQETIRLMNNEYLSDKVLSGMEQVKQKKVIQRPLLEVEDV